MTTLTFKLKLSKKPLSELTKLEKLALRNERLRADFEYFTKSQHLNSEYVVQTLLCDKYLPLEEVTIWRIVRKQDPYND